MKRIFYFLTLLMMSAITVSAQKQMSPPHVMIVPDMIYCKTNG